MPRFASMLRSSFDARGYETASWSSGDRWHRFFAMSRASKWAGYADQYLEFPTRLRRMISAQPLDTLFVFCDQALGPLVPYLAQRPHVVHCHDFLALRSALGEIPEQRTRLSGRIYQRYIRRGFRAARHFISVSSNTRDELHRVGMVAPVTSEVVYNGLNADFFPLERGLAMGHLISKGFGVGGASFLLHVGGDLWYKNRPGLFQIYATYGATAEKPLPLVVVGAPPTGGASRAALASARKFGSVQFYENVATETLRAAYSAASALLFPSLAEGFGWPIAEAMACGCQVITTNEPPMTEVGGGAANYLPRMPTGDSEAWARSGAQLLNALLAQDDSERARRSSEGLEWVKRFQVGAAIDAYERIYRRVFAYERAAAAR